MRPLFPEFALKAGAAMALAASASPATAEMEYSNDTGGSAKFYGQLSPTYLGFDDGEKSYGNLVDNSRSNSRVGLFLEQDLDTTTLKFNFEAALGAPQSSTFSQDFDPVWEWEQTDLRRFEVIWSGAFGTVSAGQGSMASDNTASVDLSQTIMASTVTISDAAGGYFLRETNGDLSSTTIGTVFKDFDGGRKARLRYDTPNFNGFTVAAAYGTDVLTEGNEAEYYDVGLFYSNEIGDLKLQGGAGYGWTEDDSETSESYSGSFSILHIPTGLNGTFASGGADGGGQYTYVKAGWLADLWQVGRTSLSVDYYTGSDVGYDGTSSDAWGLQAVQKFDDLNLEAYLAYGAYKLDDDSGARYQDASSMLAGVRWQF